MLLRYSGFFILKKYKELKSRTIGSMLHLKSARSSTYINVFQISLYQFYSHIWHKKSMFTGFYVVVAGLLQWCCPTRMRDGELYSEDINGDDDDIYS